MKKILLSIVLVVFCLVNIFSAEVTLQEVRKVARVHSQLGYELKSKTGVLSAPGYSFKEDKALIDPLSNNVLAHVITLKPKGFIVISKDDDISPVVAYSFENNFSFSEDSKNILIYMLRRDVKMRMEAIPFTSDVIKNKNKRLWNNYLNSPDYANKIKGAKQWPEDNSSGWLATTWHQDTPYNNLCPIDPLSSQRSVVGCVATAVAQIVNFHKYPPSISFDSAVDNYTTFTRGIQIPGDYVACDFPSFSELNSKLSTINYDGSEGHAPALSFACGVIAEMDYTSGESGAWFSAYKFITKLEYDDAINVTGNNSILYDTLQDDMKNRRPAYLAIRTGDLQSGHAIVVDGYRDSGEYHLNFGWGILYPESIGACWYLLPEGIPAGYSVVSNGIFNITAPDMNPYNAYLYPISYPNPFRLGEVNKVIITMPDKPVGYISRVRIHTLAGHIIKEISGGDLFVEWDGKNDSGNYCVPGLYFYSMRTSENKVHKGKITVLK